MRACDLKVKVYAVQEGYIYEASGKRLGPFSIKDHDEPDFKNKLAIELGVKQKDILRAELNNNQRLTTIEEIIDILSSTIKRDNPTKVLVFLAMLATYTEEDQQNIALQAESSSGKSYIPLEIASYFPDEDKIIIASASPTAFFHETGTLVDENGEQINFIDKPSKNASSEERSEWDKRLRNSHILVNLEQKILIFLDQPHYMLMEKLRSLLSHDQKELQYKITDKTQRFGLRTKNVTIRGYPTIIFCSAKLKLDEQEKTRVFLLSPEVTEEKLLQSIYLIGEKVGNRDCFKELLESDARRLWLKNRVHSIRTAAIRDVVIADWENICKKFVTSHPNLAPRHQRDFPRLIALIKSHALLNWAHRESLPNKRIKANTEDIDAGFKLYNQIAKQNELGLSPHLYDIHLRVIEPILDQEGIDRRTILNTYYKVYHRPLSDEKLRREILPALVAAGLIVQDRDPNDKRRMLVYSPDQSPISSKDDADKEDNNRGSIRGVKENVLTFQTSQPLIIEIIDKLRKEIPEKFLESDFVEYAVKLGLSEEETSKLFRRLVKEGKILRNPEGYWQWI